MEQTNDACEEVAVSSAAEAVETAGEPASQAKSQKVKDAFKHYFTATRISYMALFTALAYVLYLPYLEFSLIPAVPFLKVDFSNSFVLIAGFSLGPVAGVIVGVLKELIHWATFSSTGGVGEAANILIMLPYILVPSLLYKKYKGIKAVLVVLAGCCVLQAVWSIPVNYLLTFPFFATLFHMCDTWAEVMQYYLSVWYCAVLFNLIKTVLVTVAVVLLYKPLSRLIKITNAKFEKLNQKRRDAKKSFRQKKFKA